MKIELNIFDQKSIKEAIYSVELYKEYIGYKERELLQRLSMYGATKVSLGFQSATYNDDFVDWEVHVNENFHDAEIIAFGQSVCFIEFGAGVKFNGIESNYPIDKPKGIVGIGKYGKGHGSDPNGWFYKGADGKYKRTFGNPANMPMFKALTEVAENVVDIAREVFNSDR